MEMLREASDLEEWLQSHQGQRVLLFKHSTTCPISAAAYRQVSQFESDTHLPVAMVRVIEERPLSNAIAQRFGIVHQSPQALVIEDNGVAWHTSHYDITAEALAAAMNR